MSQIYQFRLTWSMACIPVLLMNSFQTYIWVTHPDVWLLSCLLVLVVIVDYFAENIVCLFPPNVTSINDLTSVHKCSKQLLLLFSLDYRNRDQVRKANSRTRPHPRPQSTTRLGTKSETFWYFLWNWRNKCKKICVLTVVGSYQTMSRIKPWALVRVHEHWWKPCGV